MSASIYHKPRYISRILQLRTWHYSTLIS